MKTENCKCKQFIENFKKDATVRGLTYASAFGLTAILMLLFGFWRVLFVFLMVGLGYVLGTGLFKKEVNKIVPHKKKVIYTKEDLDEVHAVLKNDKGASEQESSEKSKK